MHKATIIILSLFSLTKTFSFGQKTDFKTAAIDMYAYHIDTTKSSTDTVTFLIDSVQVTAKIQKNRVIATCIFEQSKSVLIINLYSRDNDLVSAKIMEQSPTMDAMNSNSFFYYEKGKLFDENYSRTIRPCIAIPMDKSIYELYGYNPALNATFLKKFVLLLYNKIKPQQYEVYKKPNKT